MVHRGVRTQGGGVTSLSPRKPAIELAQPRKAACLDSDTQTQCIPAPERF